MRCGQAYLESLLAVLALPAALFGALQVALLMGEGQLLHHAAARAARARTVGFNDWMAEKAARVAAIPVSGRILGDGIGLADAAPGGEGAFEMGRIPEYLRSENRARAEYVLDYEEWHGGRFSFEEDTGASGAAFVFSALHDAPLRLPLGFLAVPSCHEDEDGVPRFTVRGSGVAPNHAALYLEGAR